MRLRSRQRQLERRQPEVERQRLESRQRCECRSPRVLRPLAEFSSASAGEFSIQDPASNRQSFCQSRQFSPIGCCISCRQAPALPMQYGREISVRRSCVRHLKSSATSPFCFGSLQRRAIPVSHIPFPHRYDEKSQYDFKAFLDLLFLNDVNAIFIELIQGEGGIRVVDQYCLNLLLEKCRKNDVYIVVDEVQTGLMRTGKMFACNHYDLEPDIICLGKALSGGAIPIAATVAKKEFDLKPGQHSNTFGGGPLACEVALALIDELKKLDPFSLDEKGRILENFAPEGLGFMRRVVLESKEKRDDVVDKALHKGLLLLGAGEKSIRLMPPLNISVENLERGLNILKECM